MSQDDADAAGGHDLAGASAEEEEIAAVNTYKALREGLTVVEDTLILAKQSLERNPSDEERRQIDAQILDLAEEKARINAKMLALINRGKALTAPSDEARGEIARLSAEVERRTNEAAAASVAISLATDVLDMASKVDFG